MIVVTGSVTAREETFDEVRRLSLQHVHRSRAEPGCISHDVHVDCEHPMRLCSSSNGPIGPRSWRISLCRPRATSFARCSRWRRLPLRFSSTMPPNWKSSDSRMHGWIAIPISYCNATYSAVGIRKIKRETP